VRRADMNRNNNGSFMWCWSGKDQSGKSVATGVYLAKVKSEGNVEQRKILLIK